MPQNFRLLAQSSFFWSEWTLSFIPQKFIFRSKSETIVFGYRFSFKCDQENPKRTTTRHTVIMFLKVSQVTWSPPNLAVFCIANRALSPVKNHLVVQFSWSWSHRKANQLPKIIAWILDRKMIFLGMNGNVHSYRKNEFWARRLKFWSSYLFVS